MTELNALVAANAKRWAAAKTRRDFGSVAQALIAAKKHYKNVEALTDVPWFVVAVIHERECSQSWSGSLAQGDPWDKVSIHVPAGRGPFTSWENAAVDALTNCAPHAAGWKDWSIGGALTLLEQYNGLGYANRGLPSPYIWSGTDQYSSGKYVRDGVYDPAAIDRQLGCAALLMALMTLDSTVTFTGAKNAASSSPPPVTNPAPSSIRSFVSNLIFNIFKRKT